MTNPREQLRDLMSDISEDCWCAGWISGLEYSLWTMIQGGNRKFGMDEVPETEIAELRRLSDEAGGWWVWSDKAMDEVFLPMSEWLAEYAAKMAPAGIDIKLLGELCREEPDESTKREVDEMMANLKGASK